MLDAQAFYQDGTDDAPTLAKLYNTYMIDPYPKLTAAHNTLNKAVDKAYGYKGKGDDASRVEFLRSCIVLNPKNSLSVMDSEFFRFQACNNDRLILT